MNMSYQLISVGEVVVDLLNIFKSVYGVFNN